MIEHIQPLLNSSSSLLDLQTRLVSSIRCLPRLPSSCRFVPQLNHDNYIYSDSAAWAAIASISHCAGPQSPLRESMSSPLITGDRRKCTAFTAWYASLHTSPVATDVIPPPPDLDRSVPPITEWELRSSLRTLSSRGASDDHGISPKFLKRTAPWFLALLAAYYTNILQDPTSIPSDWKHCTFIPILKPDKPPELISSYRPVSITSLLCRLCESVLASRLCHSVQDHLHLPQYGFRPGRSTLDAIAAVVGTASTLNNTVTPRKVAKKGASTMMPYHCITLLGFVDLSDAFTKVPHDLLLAAARTFLERPPLRISDFL